MKSWRTTLGGLLAALGTAAANFGSSAPAPDWLVPAGQITQILGLAFLGLNARDNKVTSEQAGAIGSDHRK